MNKRLRRLLSVIAAFTISASMSSLSAGAMGYYGDSLVIEKNEFVEKINEDGTHDLYFDGLKVTEIDSMPSSDDEIFKLGEELGSYSIIKVKGEDSYLLYLAPHYYVNDKDQTVTDKYTVKKIDCDFGNISCVLDFNKNQCINNKTGKVLCPFMGTTLLLERNAQIDDYSSTFDEKTYSCFDFIWHTDADGSKTYDCSMRAIMLTPMSQWRQVDKEYTDKTKYLEKFSEYFNVYKYSVNYLCGDKMYSYLAANKEQADKIVVPKEYTLKNIDELSESEWYYQIKPGMKQAYYDEYKKLKPNFFRDPSTLFVFYDEKGEVSDVKKPENKDAAELLINEFGVSEGSYEIIKPDDTLQQVYQDEPIQFKGPRTAEYLDEKGNVLSSISTNGKEFGLIDVENSKQVRFVSDYSSRYVPDSTKIMFGDLNGDGTEDLKDLMELSMYLLGDSKLTEDQKLAADVNGDGILDIADLPVLRQYIMGDKITLGKQYGQSVNHPQ